MAFIVNNASSEVFSSFELEPPHPIKKNDRKTLIRKRTLLLFFLKVEMLQGRILLQRIHV